MKKMNVLCLVFILVSVLSACNKTAITAEEFTSKATSLGFTVVDITEQYEGKTIAALIAIDSTKSYQIEFYEVANQSLASGMFSQNSEILNQIGSGTSTSASGSNWAFLSKTAGGAYGYASYINTTFVYAREPEEYKEAIKNVMKELGY